MPRYEYKVVPAPAKGQKARGVKTPQDRFAHSIETILNTLAAEGWEYLRSDMLPSEERTGLTGSTTNWRNVLVFRRVIGGEEPAFVSDGGAAEISQSGFPPLGGSGRGIPSGAPARSLGAASSSAAGGAAPPVFIRPQEPARHQPEEPQPEPVSEAPAEPEPAAPAPEPAAPAAEPAREDRAISGIEKVMRRSARTGAQTRDPG